MRQLVGVPYHGIGDGFVPQAAHFALAVAELRHDYVLGLFPTAGEGFADAHVPHIGDAQVFNGLSPYSPFGSNK